MENKKKTNFAPLIIIFILVLSALVLGYFTITKITNTVTVTRENEKFGLDEARYNKLKEPTSYGSPISLTEPGYGRVNPFAPYK